LERDPRASSRWTLVVSGLLCVVPIGLGAYLMSRAHWEPVWAAWLYFDVTLQLGLLLVFVGAARVAWLMRTWRRRCRGREAAKPPYEMQLADGRRVVVRDPLTAALVVYLVPQVFLVWLAVVVRDVRRVRRARGRAGAFIGRATFLSMLGALTISAVVGWLFLLVPVPSVWILTPADLPFAPVAWPPVPLPPLPAYVVVALTAPTVVVYGQLMANRLLREAGTVIFEGPG
jgi:membrane protein implicated in regulation of membrane protease activity